MLRSGRPMTTREIIASIVEKMSYGPDAAKGMAHRVRASFLYQTKAVGRLRKEEERETAKCSLLASDDGESSTR
jgi:hypothetical protein